MCLERRCGDIVHELEGVQYENGQGDGDSPPRSLAVGARNVFKVEIVHIVAVVTRGHRRGRKACRPNVQVQEGEVMSILLCIMGVKLFQAFVCSAQVANLIVW